jgi:hypothetical protein
MQILETALPEIKVVMPQCSGGHCNGNRVGSEWRIG